jgi:hypothetical protein
MSNFLQNENKELLWNLLSDNGLFKNINPSYFKNVKIDFDESIGLIEQNNKNDQLIVKNKLFIENMIKTLEKYKQELNYNIEHRKKKRMNEFESSYQQKQEEFNALNKKNVPNTIDFSDNNKEDNENIDLLLQQKQRERDNDLPIPSTYQNDIHSEIKQEIESSLSQIEKIPQINQQNQNDEILSEILKLLMKIIENQEKIIAKIN